MHIICRYLNCRAVPSPGLPQGVFPPRTYDDLGLPPHWYGCLEWQYPPHQRMGAYEEQGRAVNHMKAGISTADRLVTVSGEGRGAKGLGLAAQIPRTVHPQCLRVQKCCLHSVQPASGDLADHMCPPAACCCACWP